MTNEEKLAMLITEYFDTKEEADFAKKRVEKLNSEIKSLMKELDLTELNNGYCTAKYSVEQRDSLDEDGLAIYLATSTESNAIYLKEAIKMDEFEKELYNDIFTDEQLKEINKFHSTKDVVKLTVRRNK